MVGTESTLLWMHIVLCMTENRDGFNGVGPSHLGAFREGVYHLGHVRFRVFTLAHEKNSCTRPFAARLSFLWRLLFSRSTLDESSRRRCIRLLLPVTFKNGTNHLI